jgi:hypothetical protein
LLSAVGNETEFALDVIDQDILSIGDIPGQDAL